MAIDPAVLWLKRRRTKLVATLGPASSDADTIAQLIASGVNMFRLNMSHGEHAAHQETIKRIRAADKGTGVTVSILADLAGPKIRVGRFEGGGIELTNGHPVVITTRDVRGHDGLIPSQYEALATDLSAGDRVLLADGAMELSVDAVDGTEVRCTVVQGGFLSDRKGINLPGVKVSAPCLTEKDKRDARFLLGLGVDFFGLSFVREGSDVLELRALIEAAGGQAAIIAKIERPEALDNSDAVLAAADGIMVARGDLGVELPPEQVPFAQMQLVERARRANKPVIVATQMLESMIENPRPTRAEVSDVSHAVMEGADAVMLSGETAAGAHPVAAVDTMNRIARQSEAYLWKQGNFGDFATEASADGPVNFGDAVARSVAQLSRDLRVRAIIAISRSGMSASTVSAARPAAPLIAISPSAAACRRMNLLWGVIPALVEEAELADGVGLARRLAVELDLAAAGDYILLVKGFAQEQQANTPSITLLCL